MRVCARACVRECVCGSVRARTVLTSTPHRSRPSRRRLADVQRCVCVQREHRRVEHRLGHDAAVGISRFGRRTLGSHNGSLTDALTANGCIRPLAHNRTLWAGAGTGRERARPLFAAAPPMMSLARVGTYKI